MAEHAYGDTAEKTPSVLLWVHEERKVLSFHAEEGFLALSFPSREAMLSFALKKGASGFCIQ